jgi:hypothetical protein
MQLINSVQLDDSDFVNLFINIAVDVLEVIKNKLQDDGTSGEQCFTCGCYHGIVRSSSEDVLFSVLEQVFPTEEGHMCGTFTRSCV